MASMQRVFSIGEQSAPIALGECELSMRSIHPKRPGRSWIVSPHLPDPVPGTHMIIPVGCPTIIRTSDRNRRKQYFTFPSNSPMVSGKAQANAQRIPHFRPVLSSVSQAK